MGLFDIFKRKEEVISTNPGPQVTPVTFEGYEETGFEFLVEDVFTISGRGTVVTGRIAKGTISVGESVNINGVLGSTITGIEAFRSKKDYATEGENVGLLLSGVDRTQVKRGDRIYK